MHLPSDYPCRVAPAGSIAAVDLSTRTTRACRENDITAIRQLRDWNPQNASYAGEKVVRELAAVAIRAGIMPAWFKGEAKGFRYDTVTPDESQFVRIAGPYIGTEERWMLEAAIIQLGSVPHVIGNDGEGYTLWRAKAGCKETTPEEV